MRGALAWPGRLGAGSEEADPGAEAAVQRRRHRLRVLDWFAAAAGGVVWWWSRGGDPVRFVVVGPSTMCLTGLEWANLRLLWFLAKRPGPESKEENTSSLAK